MHIVQFTHFTDLLLFCTYGLCTFQLTSGQRVSRDQWPECSWIAFVKLAENFLRMTSGVDGSFLATWMSMNIFRLR